MELLYPYGGAFVAPFAAAYVASFVSRLQLRRGKRPDWLTRSVALLGGILVAWVCAFQFDAFLPWRWSVVGGKVDLGLLLLATGVLTVLTCAVPTVLVIRRYQKTYDKAFGAAGQWPWTAPATKIAS